jgi:hypothetical protein
LLRLQIITLILALSAPALAQTTFTSATSGDWDDGGTWGNTSPGVQGTDWPATTDHAVIAYGHTVTLQQSNTIANFTINHGGQFYFNSFTLTATGTVTPFVAQATGDFDQASTWLNGSAPGVVNDDIVVTIGLRVTLVSNTVLNDLSVNSSGVFDDSNNNIQVDGNLYLNGIMAGSRDLQFTGGAGTTIDGSGGHSAKNFDINGSTTILSTANLTFGATVDMINGGTTTNNGSVTFVGDLKSTGAASTWINAANSTLKATLTVFNGSGNLQASATGNTVIYSEAGNQTIKDPTSSTYYNLTVAGTGTKTMSTGTIILGDLEITSGILNAPTAFSIGGNFTSSGTFDENTGTVTFDGIGEQTITKTGGETFYNIILDKASGTLNLADDVIASNALTLTQGLIDAGSNMLTLGTGTGNEGTLTHTAGQIIGQFERWVASSTTSTDIVFPVGSTANENPAVINFDGIVSGGTVIFQFIESNPSNAGLSLVDGITIYNTFVDGYWDMSKSASFNLGLNSFNLNLDGTGFTAFTIAATTRLLTRSDAGSNWVAEGTHVAAVSPVVKRSVLSTIPAQYAFGDNTNCTPPSTSVITGTAEVCTSETAVAYSVVNTIGSTYAWTITGGTQVSGTNTSSITVDWGATGIAGNVRVVETNSCTSGSVVDLPVNVNSIAPTSITGSTIVPEFTSGLAYSVTGLAGYTYAWTITGGTQATGGTTSSITVDWTFPGIGNISVVAQKAGCTAAAAYDVDITIYDVINSVTSGPWRTASTWETNTVPTSVENARIMNGDVVTISNNETINNLIIQLGATLTNASSTLTVDGDLTVDGFYQGGIKDLIVDGINSNIDGSGTINIVASSIAIGTGPKTISPTAVLTVLNGDIDIGIGITVTNQGSIEVADNITGANATSSNWINDVNSNLTIGTSIFASKGVLTATALGNHVSYNGAAQNIEVPSASTYQNLSFEGSGAKTLEGSIQINEDFDIAGSASLDADGNAVTLSGTTAQAITDASTADIDFFDLIVNNTSGTIPQITTNGAMNVTNSATFTDGVVDNTGTFTFNDATATSTTDSYIDGPVTFIDGTGTTGFTFPIGEGSIWARLGISSLAASSQFTAQYFFADPQVTFGTTIDATDFPGGTANISTEEYWQLDYDGGGTETANVTLYWEDGTRSVITDLADLTITKWDGADWGNDGGINTTTSGTPAAGSVTTTSPYTTFSPFSFASPLGNNALPVELVYFHGKLLSQGVVLEWQTASELNNDFFEIEVSTDGENYTTLANIEGQGSSTSVTNYDYVDRYPSTGLNYYRLRQVDFNGDFTFSNIISVMNDAPAKLFFSAYPQPASSHLTLQLMAIDDTSIMNLVIYNMNGKVIRSISIDPKTKQLPVDISAFTNGLYLVRLNQAAQAFHGRLLIQK